MMALSLMHRCLAAQHVLNAPGLSKNTCRMHAGLLMYSPAPFTLCAKLQKSGIASMPATPQTLMSTIDAWLLSGA